MTFWKFCSSNQSTKKMYVCMRVYSFLQNIVLMSVENIKNVIFLSFRIEIWMKPVLFWCDKDFHLSLTYFGTVLIFSWSIHQYCHTSFRQACNNSCLFNVCVLEGWGRMRHVAEEQRKWELITRNCQEVTSRSA